MLYEFLFEDRIKDAEKVFNDSVGRSLFQKLFGMEPKIPGKYALWTAKELKKDYTINLEYLHHVLLDFDKYVQGKDINSFDSIRDLDYAAQAARVEHEEKKEIRRKAAEREKTYKELETHKSESEILFDDGQYLVVKPLSTEASCFFGRDTKWCISAIESENYFKSYTEQGLEFVFIIDRKQVRSNPYAKVAVAYAPPKEEATTDIIEIYDSQDKVQTETDLVGKYPHNVIDAVNKALGRQAIPATEEESYDLVRGLDNRAFTSKLVGWDNLVQQNQDLTAEDFQNIKNRIQSFITHASRRQVGYALMYQFSDFGQTEPSHISAIIQNLLLTQAAKMISDMNGIYDLIPTEGHYSNQLWYEIRPWLMWNGPLAAKIKEVLDRTVGKVSADVKASFMEKQIGSGQSYAENLIIEYLNGLVYDDIEKTLGQTIRELFQSHQISVPGLKAAYRDAVEFTRDSGGNEQQTMKLFGYMEVGSTTLRKVVSPSDLMLLYMAVRNDALKANGMAPPTIDRERLGL